MELYSKYSLYHNIKLYFDHVTCLIGIARNDMASITRRIEKAIHIKVIPTDSFKQHLPKVPKRHINLNRRMCNEHYNIFQPARNACNLQFLTLSRLKLFLNYPQLRYSLLFSTYRCNSRRKEITERGS